VSDLLLDALCGVGGAAVGAAVLTALIWLTER
jgi:hypothetical protein